MDHGYLVGYDPGGNGTHGVALLTVRRSAKGDGFQPIEICAELAGSVQAALDWLVAELGEARILAAGVDTLTEWNTGKSGCRPADLWLRQRYPSAQRSVVSPNSLYGAMALGGAAFINSLGPRLSSERVTEVHPVVCYFALTDLKLVGETRTDAEVDWLLGQFRRPQQRGYSLTSSHIFDACMCALAALRGLNQEWTLDLHDLPKSALEELDPDDLQNSGLSVRFAGRTHYWWPPTEIAVS